MSRKDYILAAAVVREQPEDIRVFLENAFCRFFEQSPGRFDEARFRTACVLDTRPVVMVK